MTTPQQQQQKPENTPAAPARLIAPGTYRARPFAWGLVQNPDTGSASFAVEFVLRDGRQITWFGALKTEERNGTSAWEITERAMRAMGWEGDDIRTVNLTKPVNITIDHETYNGKTRAKVNSVDASILERNAMPASEKDRIAEMLKRASGQRSASQRWSGEDDEQQESDIPY